MSSICVTLPDLTLQGWSGWLCKVCRRVPLRSQPPWSWFGCEECRAVDRRAASVFGGRRILALGQHSIMNGASIRLPVAEGPALTAKLEQFAMLGSGWKDLSDWAVLEGARLVGDLLAHSEGMSGSVPIEAWLAHVPPGRVASADAYVRLLALQQPWLIEIEPRLGDAGWLTGEES